MTAVAPRHLPAPVLHHQWSPDGSNISFVSNGASTWDVYVMDGNGANQTRLTFHAVYERGGVAGPRWSPDGSRIAFARDGVKYPMNFDGSNQIHLTTRMPVSSCS